MPSLNGFDANQWEPQSFDLLPDGTYEAVITASENKDTKTGGEMLVLELQIINGKYHGRKLWDRLNLKNNNKDTEKRAKGMLSSICRAVGIMTPMDSSELHNIPMYIGVGSQPAHDEYAASNKIKSYRAPPVGPPIVAPAVDLPKPAPADTTPAKDDGIPF